MPTFRHGRHENGQNFLTDPAVIATFVDLVASTRGPILEIGPGNGALSVPLARLGRPLTVVEIDPRLARRVRRRLPRQVRVVTADVLNHRLPESPHVVVGNLPFHQTTAMLRHLLHAPSWTDAVLITQWEVARRRAGVGGATMMTAQWAPWFTFTLHGRVPARAFSPRPGVDGGLLVLHRREQPLLPLRQRRRFQALVHRVYTGPGRGLAGILPNVTPLVSPREARRWLEQHGVDPLALPRAMQPEAWVDLFAVTGSSPPPRRVAEQGRGRRR